MKLLLTEQMGKNDMPTILLMAELVAEGRLFEQILAYAGYSMLRANDVAEAFEKERQQQIDILLLLSDETRMIREVIEEFCLKGLSIRIPYLICTKKSVADLQKNHIRTSEKYVYQFPWDLKILNERIRTILDDFHNS